VSETFETFTTSTVMCPEHSITDLNASATLFLTAGFGITPNLRSPLPYGELKPDDHTAQQHHKAAVPATATSTAELNYTNWPSYSLSTKYRKYRATDLTSR
jgi:hypothetical protein